MSEAVGVGSQTFSWPTQTKGVSPISGAAEKSAQVCTNWRRGEENSQAEANQG